MRATKESSKGESSTTKVLNLMSLYRPELWKLSPSLSVKTFASVILVGRNFIHLQPVCRPRAITAVVRAAFRENRILSVEKRRDADTKSRLREEESRGTRVIRVDVSIATSAHRANRA